MVAAKANKQVTTYSTKENMDPDRDHGLSTDCRSQH